MFSGAHDVMINGGSFTMGTAHLTIDRRLDRLLEEVAPNAISNAGGRADEVQCYPGTREDVMGRMEKWMDGKDSGKGPGRMLWLSGPAGAGKSAIMQTLAQRCQNRGKHVANFFFFRNDMTRNHAQPLVATLAYQLRAFYPALNNLLGDCLMATPLICKASISEQFRRLISSPIHTVQNSSSIPQPIIIIIDGLDECSNKREQEQVLAALHSLVENDESRFHVVVASRAEPHIAMSVNKLGASVVTISLDDNYQPQDDIRRFVIAKFDEIKQAHCLAHMLDKHWPTPKDIDAIIEKSSGQFIYAATVMRFIESSGASPSLSLLTIQGILLDVNHNPYAQLDAVYSHILSQSHNIKAIKFILGIHFAILMNPTAFSGKVALDFKSLVHYAGYHLSAEDF
ncbi:hypothetical protein D9619_012290 [Psilocybe cf. subviscida]|uniref:NACHT domain-containing protein n=1 Tax=Psilocybe cf. subviscida TaxID=2480587 RepID=A0A8H5ER98_9AGAR|nr:hypothetical protein D9619_012290 [Psilocybe cf. subviscida]